MFNPDPQNYLGLRDGFNALGRELYPKAWTDSELDARDLPKLDDLRRLIEKVAKQVRERKASEPARRVEIDRLVEADRRAHAAKAAMLGKSIAGSSGGAEPVGPVGSIREEIKKTRPLHDKTAAPDQAQQQQDQIVAIVGRTTIEVVVLSRDELAYRNEYDARQRRKKTEQAFCMTLYSGRRRSVLLNASDGRAVDIPRTLWMADMFSVSFAQGTGRWTDNEGGHAIEYSGLVWIERGDGLPIVAHQPQDRGAGSRPGRPSLKPAIVSAYKALVAEEMIDFDAPKSKMYPLVHRLIRRVQVCGRSWRGWYPRI